MARVFNQGDIKKLSTQLQTGQRVRLGEIVPPRFKEEAFHCLHCGVYAAQTWAALLDPHPRLIDLSNRYDPSRVWECECTSCRLLSYWYEETRAGGEIEGTLLRPFGAGFAPTPHPAMPEDVLDDYAEAAGIASVSPRSAAALLRLALQKLMPHLNQSGRNLNDDIKALVAGGLDPMVQQALDALRVIGNNAVHPGELDLRDDADTAHALFDLLNFVVEQQIERPQKLDALYQALPQSAREAIDQRDA